MKKLSNERRPANCVFRLQTRLFKGRIFQSLATAVPTFLSFSGPTTTASLFDQLEGSTTQLHHFLLYIEDNTERMRKRITFRQLGRDSEHRWAMLRNMVTSLIKHERIMTTTARAKELRRVAEKLVTHAKKGTLSNRRNAAAVVQEKPALVKLFEILGPRYA